MQKCERRGNLRARSETSRDVMIRPRLSVAHVQVFLYVELLVCNVEISTPLQVQVQVLKRSFCETNAFTRHYVGANSLPIKETLLNNSY